MIKETIKKNMPAFGLRWLNRIGLYNNYKPSIGKVDLGDFKGTSPLSKEFGYDRGGPIDRYYIENFLQQNSGYIKGRVLEIGDNEYTLKFGENKIIKSDILHVDRSNKIATIVGDISDAPQIDDNTFDCIVLTQTLHLIYNYKAALQTCCRILKPGGTLLLTVPGITPIDHGEWKTTWYWSFTDKVLSKLFEEIFTGGEIETRSFGNVYAAVTFLEGLGLPEVSKKKLDYNDSHFPVINTVKAVKKITG